MRKILTIVLACASLGAGASALAAQKVAAADAEVRPDTVIQVQRGPPWANCVRWDRRTMVCRDPGWRGRSWRGWYGRSACRRGRAWWIDNWGRWRRC